MPITDRKALASEILADLERDIHSVEMQIEIQTEELRLLQAQRSAARILAGLEEVETPPKANGVPEVQLIRAKNLRDLAYQFLRDRCDNPVSIPNLWKMITRTGANIGSRTYIYKVIDDLVADGLVEKDAQGRVKAKSAANSREWKQPQITQ
jgi:hypothetical protein